MSAPTGNSNATKWTQETTIETLIRIRRYAEMNHVLTLSRALLKVRVYRGVWAYWKRRYSTSEEIMDLIYYIEEIFTMKLEEGALTKRLHSGMCMFLLKTNYGYTDKIQEMKGQKIMTNEIPAHLSSALHREQMQRMFRSDETEQENTAAPAETPTPTEQKPKAVMTVQRDEPTDEEAFQIAKFAEKWVEEERKRIAMVNDMRKNGAGDGKVVSG